jgi:hypothetical protein
MSAQTVAVNHAATSVLGTAGQLDAALPAVQVGVQGHQVLASGPAQLDVGVFDSTHGWLRVRAEMGADGAVSASLTASASAHESLRAVLPEMANYLESEAVGVSKIAVHRAADAAPSMAPNAGQGNGAGDAQPQRQDNQQRPNGTATPGPDSSPADQRATDVEVVAASPPTAQVNDAAVAQNVNAPSSGGRMGGLSPALYEFGFPADSSGSWLNVCA